MANRRNTIQRQAILDAVRELNTHATAEQVYDYVVKKYPSISKTTVYRNLSQMSYMGELLNIGNFNDSTHYDHKRCQHYHFICECCKQIFDVNAYFPDIYGKIKDMDEFEVRGHNLSFTGLCRDCVSVSEKEVCGTQ